jgi:hypothetical protein
MRTTKHTLQISRDLLILYPIEIALILQRAKDNKTHYKLAWASKPYMLP